MKRNYKYINDDGLVSNRCQFVDNEGQCDRNKVCGYIEALLTTLKLESMPNLAESSSKTNDNANEVTV